MKKRKPMATRNREPSNVRAAIDGLLCGVCALGSLVSLAVILNWIGA